MIKPKTGICLECPDKEQKYISAGRCIVGPNFHYQKHKQALYHANSAKRKKDKSLRAMGYSGMTIGQWFNFQISALPKECENCTTYLNPYAPWSSRAYIAHIVPKRHLESVATHPLNRLFLCIDCHTNFDNWLNKEVTNMRCWPIALSRYNQFKHLIIEAERKHLKDIFTTQ